MNERDSFKELLSSIHGILRLALTVPISSATAERTFSALKFVFTSQRSTMNEKRLNNCLLPGTYRLDESNRSSKRICWNV